MATLSQILPFLRRELVFAKLRIFSVAGVAPNLQFVHVLPIIATGVVALSILSLNPVIFCGSQ